MEDRDFIFYWIFSNLQVTKTAIKSRTSLLSGQIELFRAVGQSWSNFICSITGVGITGVGITGSDLIFYRIFVKLASYEDGHKISDEFDFRPDRTIDFGVTRRPSLSTLSDLNIS